MSKFIQYGNKTLTMPEGMTLEQAKQLMARHFPELAENPKVDTKKEGDDTTYIFSKQAGRKGATDEIIDQMTAVDRDGNPIPLAVAAAEIELAPDQLVRIENDPTEQPTLF